ncbi:MAG: nucleotidyl transferase AbiEii/AbiGii toxin family protein [Taibaiella sp.]|nr:nucleotidyl transferase AbiEii/AbiGii toxin family protein [Taibaiella sp.]
MKFELDLAARIRDLAIIALASDDTLFESLVLKGGNAISLFKKDTNNLSRASYDLDYSIIPGDFSDLEDIKIRIEATLAQTFRENGFELTHYTFKVKPRKYNETTNHFWGGYNVTFKVIGAEQFKRYADDRDALIRFSIPTQPDASPTFELDLSKHEEVTHMVEQTFEGYRIYVYTPLMIIFEKLRAICQQMKEYQAFVPSHPASPRSKDFYDIHLLITEELGGIFDIEAEGNQELMAKIFAAKRVPLEFIQLIPNTHDYHKLTWEEVKATVSVKEKIEDFAYYFNYVIETFRIK